MLQVPDIKKSHLAVLRMCGFVEKETPEVLKSIKKLPGREKPMVAAIGRGNNPIKIIVFGGGDKPSSGRHIHIDLVGPIMKVEKANEKTSRARELIDPLFGLSINVHVNGLFMLPVSALPKKRGVVAPMIEETKVSVGTMTIKQTRAVLEIKGGPVDTIEWRIKPDGKEVAVDIEVAKKLTLGENYLVDGFSLIHSAFRLLALGEQ